MTTFTQNSKPGEVGTLVGADITACEPIDRVLGYVFADRVLLSRALSHRSWCREQEDAVESNERLEFLGDAVLGLVVAQQAYHLYPDRPEGWLAKLRSAVVNTRVLAEVAKEIGLGEILALGRGEELSGGRSKSSILADSFEAVVGAIYLDGGWIRAEEFICRNLVERIHKAAIYPDEFDYKSRLQEESVRVGKGLPTYKVDGSGPDHCRIYNAHVFIAGQEVGTGSGTSKKLAEQDAAHNAWKEFDNA